MKGGFMRYEVIRSRQDETTGFIFLDTGSYPHIMLRGIKAGLSWPNRNAPPYFCVIGQEVHRGSLKEYPFVLLAEGTGDSLNKLFQELSDAGQILSCENIYADLNSEWEGYVKIFRDFTRKAEIHNLYLQQAPLVSNFQSGLTQIREIADKGALDIDKHTIVGGQLGRTLKGDPGERPEETFWAVNALRFVIDAFRRFSPGQKMTPQLDRELRARYGPPGVR